MCLNRCPTSSSSMHLLTFPLHVYVFPVCDITWGRLSCRTGWCCVKSGQALTTYEYNHITQLFAGLCLIGAPGHSHNGDLTWYLCTRAIKQDPSDLKLKWPTWATGFCSQLSARHPHTSQCYPLMSVNKQAKRLWCSPLKVFELHLSLSDTLSCPCSSHLKPNNLKNAHPWPHPQLWGGGALTRSRRETRPWCDCAHTFKKETLTSLQKRWQIVRRNCINDSNPILEIQHPYLLWLRIKQY